MATTSITKDFHVKNKTAFEQLKKNWIEKILYELR